MNYVFRSTEFQRALAIWPTSWNYYSKSFFLFPNFCNILILNENYHLLISCFRTGQIPSGTGYFENFLRKQYFFFFIYIFLKECVTIVNRGQNGSNQSVLPSRKCRQDCYQIIKRHHKTCRFVPILTPFNSRQILPLTFFDSIYFT